MQPDPKGPKYLAIRYLGIPYLKPYLWFWVDTLYFGAWILRESVQIPEVAGPKMCSRYDFGNQKPLMTAGYRGKYSA